MTSDEKVKWVRDKVREEESLTGLGWINFVLLPVTREVGGPNEFDDFFAIFNGEKPKSEPAPKKQVVVITVEELVNILKRLEKDGLIKISELNADNALLEVLPPHPSPIKLKTLEHISQSIANIFSGSSIVDILLDYGIPRCDIPYPNTKWRTLQELFLALATSPSSEQRGKFGGAITTFLHPLNFNADESASKNLIADFNKYLQYDGYKIALNDDGDGYELVATKDKKKISEPLTEEETAKRTEEATLPPSTRVPEPAIDLEDYYSKQVERESSFLQEPQTAERLAIIREAYKTLMAIVSSFCVDPATPLRELNTAYIELSKIVGQELNDFCGGKENLVIFNFDKYKEDDFGIPFTSLYSAELEFKNDGKVMHWNEIRPGMNAVLGQIEEVCQTAGSPDVISEPKIQKVISDAMVLLSQIAAERIGANKEKEAEGSIKMEITKMPDLRIRDAEDTVIAKGKKRVHLPKFKATDWTKITIRFIDERNVLISAGAKEQVTADYEALGFKDEKRDKPNSAWALLRELANNNGETLPLPTPIPNKIKQHKKELSDRLKVIFKNDTDPFYDANESKTYKVKFKIIPPIIEDSADKDDFGVKEHLQGLNGTG